MKFNEYVELAKNNIREYLPEQYKEVNISICHMKKTTG